MLFMYLFSILCKKMKLKTDFSRLFVYNNMDKDRTYKIDNLSIIDSTLKRNDRID